MNLLKIFGRKRITKKYCLAILYPEKIIIDTLHIVKAGFNIVSSNSTILKIDLENGILGSNIREHLNSSKCDLKNPTQSDFKLLQETFLKSYGFKSLKEYHDNAKYLTIIEHDKEIILEPNKNGGTTGTDKGFSLIPEKKIKISNNIKDEELGKLIKETWHKCI